MGITNKAFDSYEQGSSGTSSPPASRRSSLPKSSSADGSQSYTAEQRRAANQVWAAAGAYGFEPLFLAHNTDGTIDFYMNCIVGWCTNITAMTSSAACSTAGTATSAKASWTT